MEFIAHRINSKEKLSKVDNEFGIEVDLRPWGESDLIMAHDPFVQGESFEELLKNYDHGTMVLNVKSERIEEKVLELIKKYQIKDYFFLDSSIPMLNLLTSKGITQSALRLSEIESIESYELVKSFGSWVWIDCFTEFILDKKTEELIHNNGHKVCLVSPELQGRDGDIEAHAKIIKERGLLIDAICTKVYNVNRWKKLLSE